MPPPRTSLQDRYELKEVLGRGGMGVVYKAIDTLMRREVALKTILDVSNPALLELFYKEWGVLSTMVHPNLIGIYDIGEFEHEGARKPFFVMPLLPGVTLDKLIRDGSPRLSVAKIVEIVAQAARGVHAAHEKGLVHRDVKPSNIFVMDDDSVKIIDFGIAREVSTASKTSLKGTLFYMAPEQLQMKPPSPLSDQYALGVVAYEALTRRRPFQGTTDSELVDSILKSSPPPASELNTNVSYALSQVVHKALAKQPFHRFFSTKEFGDALYKALRNEPLEYFDTEKIKSRLDRARKSFESSDYQFAAEVLGEIEGEGHLDPEITLLRSQLDNAMRRTGIRQLLENARRFFEAQEYPLALRKIQEALELDPEDADTLALKSQIEKERRARKIDEWIQLARQHVDNQAFRQAREALENVLQLKPSDTDALQLVSEIDRREKDLSKAREEKSRLYQLAMQAWEKGDVTSALSKLEVLVNIDREAPEAETGRSATYQSFYNQVRSEHDGIKNHFDEARRHLASDNFEPALAICRQYLAKYPNHALFQSLKFDVEERQRQNLSQMIADTDRRVQAEPDLDKRVALLDDVIKQHPGESHFERALRLVKDKRDLVNSIVSKARFFEERNQFNESLDQWQILKSIHEEYPGLGFEIQRLQKKKEQQGKLDAKATWVRQVDRYLESGDYGRADKALASALQEFPEDAELFELEKLVRKNKEAHEQASHLLTQARDLNERGATGESLAALRQGLQLDPKNSVVRTVLQNSLLDQAQKLVESDAEAASALVQELLELEPNHAVAQSLAVQISDRKRDEFLTWCLSQARRLQAESDVDGAMAVVKQGLEAYPQEKRLLDLEATLGRGRTDVQMLVTRAKDVEELQKILKEAAGVKEPSQLSELVGKGSAIANRYPNDAEIQDLAAQLRKYNWTPASATPSTKQPPAESSRDMAPTTTMPLLKHPGEKRPDLPRTVQMPASPPPLPPKTGKKESPSKQEPVPQVKKGAVRPWWFWAAASGAGVVLLVAAAVGIGRLRSSGGSAPEPIPGAVKVSLRASVPGAAIAIDGQTCGTGQCEVELAPGSHRAEAKLAGYRSAVSSFEVTSQGAPPAVELALSPLPPFAQVAADMPDGSVTLNGKPAGTLQGGTLDLNDLAVGENTLDFASGAFRAQIRFEAAQAAAPKVLGAVRTQGLKAVVVTGVGGNARVHSSVDGAQLTIDGKPAGAIPADGLPVGPVPEGSHELIIAAPGDQPHKFIYEAGAAPSLIASLFSNANLGALLIITGVDDVTVYIDGQKNRRPTQRGRLVAWVAPTKHTVRVEKEGFLTPPDQSAEVKRGDQVKVEFQLQPAPQRATLSIRNAIPGADVFFDNNKLGTVGLNGAFTAANLEAGRHTISLRKDRYKTVQQSIDLTAGKTLEVDGNMDGAVGTLKVEVTPQVSDVRLTVRREGETEDRPVAETTLQLPEGTYTVTGSARGYQSYSATVRVQASRTVTAAIALQRQESKKGKGGSGPAFTLADWEKAGGWTREGEALVRKGGNYFLAPVAARPGAYTFTVLSQKGRRLSWVVDYRDERNHVLYEFDDKELERIEVVNGKKSTKVKVPHSANRKQFVTIAVNVTANSIGTSILRGGQWQILESSDRAGAATGSFGFYVPGRDQIAVTDFRFQ